jgi:hypothetical protein
LDQETTQHIIEGRKTFFVVPDVSLLPENYLEDFMTHGYEAYIIGDDRQCPLVNKVEVIMNTFPDSIFFFYIDAHVDGVDWSVYIRNLQEQHQENALIGVLYAKRADEAQKKALEKYFLFDVGIQCGCISLEYQKSKNFDLIEKVLFANQASGRRQNVRAICDQNSKVSIQTAAGISDGKILDVSMSHFSCLFNLPPRIKMYEKVSRVMLNVNGTHFMTDAILFMTRPVDGRDLYIFVFANSAGGQGLDPDAKERLSKKIYTMISEKAKKLMQEKFTEERNKLANKSNPFTRTYSASDFN